MPFPNTKITSLASVLILLAAGYLGAQTSQPAQSPPPGGRHGGVHAECAKAVEDATWHDAKRDRYVPVRIYAPKDAEGRLPAVVFSHGGGESREAFTYLGSHWARHGYIVLFLTHPGSDRASIEASGKTGLAAMAALDGIEKFHRRPEDVRFVLDRLLSKNPGSKLLAGRVDPDRLAVAGQCAGATTALAMVGLRVNLPEGKDVTFLDPRFKCAIALSPQPGGRPTQFGLHSRSWSGIRTPTLIVTGTRDFNWFPQIRANPRLVRRPYDDLPPGDKYLVEIADAEHNAFTDSVPCYPAGNRDPRHHGWICDAATAFLDAHLKSDEAARAWLEREELEKATKGACRQERKPLDFSAVDAHIEGALNRIGGGCCLILIQGDRVVHRKAYGTFTLDRVVPIASASKWISGGVIMALVDEGAITLDTKASGWLKNFAGHKAGITVRQMFSHTHGFPDEPHPHRDTRMTMEQAIEQIARVPLAYEPGTKLLYSGLGMQAAGRLCVLATGKEWTRIFREQIGDPLRMSKTDYFAFGKTANPNVAGSVRTCVDDYGNFMRMLLNGGLFEGKRILSEKAVETMLTNQTGAVPIERSACQPYADIDAGFAQSRYGIGCWLEQIDPKTGVAGEATSAGAFGCVPFIDRQRKIAGVYLPMSRNMKRNHKGDPYNDAAAVFLELRPMIRDAFDGKAPAGTPAAVATPTKEVERGPREQAGDGDVKSQVERMFQFFDRDRDGALAREEMPERLKRRFDAIDRDRNRKVSKDEMTAALEQYRRRRDGQTGQRRREDSQPGRARTAPGAGVGCAELVRLRDDKRGKDLQVRVTWPEQDGRYPVIVFSHRVGGARHDYRPLVEHWARGGYVVLQADHSDSRELAHSGPALDWVGRARDMSFIVDSLAKIEAKAPGVKGRMDSRRIGVGGHLIGAYSTCVLAGQKSFGATAPRDLKDDRVKAALLLSPQGRGQGLTEKSWEQVAAPLMVLSGSEIPSRRTGNPAQWRREPFTFSPPGDKYLVWIEGLEGTYAGLIQPGQGDDEWAAKWILDATLSFWDAHLKEDADARARLRAWPVPDADKARLRIEYKVDAGASAPAEAPPAQVPGAFNKVFAERAADYSARNGGRVVLVMVDGKTVFERYEKGYGLGTATHLHSATKGFWGPVIAAMIEDGLIESFDEPAVKTLPEWKDDPRKSRITLRHLLNLNAGLVQDVVKLQGHGRPTLAPDLYKHAIGVRAAREPGAVFQYGPSCYYVLGEIMKRKLAARKETPLDYLKRRILDPIDVKVGQWVHDASGNPHIPNGAHLTAREWAKYGQWLLQEGAWKDKQIVRKDLLGELVKPGKANPGHGLAIWLNQPGGQGAGPWQKARTSAKAGFIYHDGYPDLFAALGAGKCRLYVIPSLKMVVLRQADAFRDRYRDDTFLRLLLTRRKERP